jgi:hypothetical protein
MQAVSSRFGLTKLRLMRYLIFGALVLLVATQVASAGLAVGNGAAVTPSFLGTCTESSTTSCTVTVSAGFGYSQCIAIGQAAPFIPATCSIAGTTVTVSNSSNFVQAGSCTLNNASPSTCTFTYGVPYSAAPSCTTGNVAPLSATMTIYITSTPGTSSVGITSSANTVTSVVDVSCVGIADPSSYTFTVLGG